jgi:hypothetical protein
MDVAVGSFETLNNIENRLGDTSVIACLAQGVAFFPKQFCGA